MQDAHWTSQRGDEWWRGSASAGYTSGAFTIGSFGKSTGTGLAYALLCDAKSIFPEAMLYVCLDDETRPILSELSNRGQVTWTEIEISPRTRMARIENIHRSDGARTL
jgi:hypothetical protein